MINHPTLTITPSSATPLTEINFSTTPIFNGTAPYSVQIIAHEIGGHSIASCSNILENGTCNGTFSGWELFNTGIIPINAIITDSVGNIGQSNMVSIDFVRETEGEPLMV
jgi:hypothetical protein